MERFFKRPLAIVLVIAAITVFFALQLPKARLDNNNFRFVPRNDPERLAALKIDEVFGSQMLILVGLERRGKTVLDADFLSKVREYGKKVEELPIVDSVTSIVTTDYIGGSADGIAVVPMVGDDFTGTPGELAAVKDRLLEWDMYRRTLVSDDFSATQIIISLDLSADNAGTSQATETYRQVKRLAGEAGFKGTAIHVTGMPVFSSVINDATSADLRMLVPLVILAVLCVLFLSFRRIGGIVLPLLTVVISSIWAIGAMALFGVKLSIISTILPVILVAVGSAYGIHVVSHYYDTVAGMRNMGKEEHRKILFRTMEKIGRPVLLAALTTFAGFGSLCFTSVVPIFEFGIFASFGVIVAFVVSLTLIPALLLLRGPDRKVRKAEGRSEEGSNTLSARLADFFCVIARKKKTTLFVGFAVTAFSVMGISRLVIDNVMVEYFRKDSPIVKSDEYIRKYFGGTKNISVVVRGEKPGDVLMPDVLAAMDGLSTYLMTKVPEVGKTTGFTDLVKRINQVFNADESPDGLSRTVGAAALESDSGFGFGFAEAGSAEDGTAAPAGALAPAEAMAEATAPAEAIPAGPSGSLDQLRLVTLLSEALAHGSERGMSGDELVAALAKETNYRGAAYYEIPSDPARYAKEDAEGLKALIGNYLVLLSGDLSSFADDPLEPTSVRMNVQLRTVGQKDTDRAILAIREYVAENFPERVTVEIGGNALVEISLNNLVVRSQLSSVASSLLMVFLILAFYYRSAIAGLIALTPLAISILINFGVMGYFGVKLNIGTAMVASIAVGVGIDYIIHYMAAYRHEYLRKKEGRDFLRRTFLTSGKAIIFNAASVGAGFAVLAFSRFNMLAYFGGLVTLTMATSSLVSLTVLPVLLDVLKPAFIRKAMPFDDFEAGGEDR